MSQPTGEPWIRAAMSDDHIVAELLLGIQGSSSRPSTTAVKPLSWTIRQRRSRPPPHDSSKTASRRRRLRSSPTTPLSCSAGTSQEYGSEESTRNHAHVSTASEPARSKINNEDGEKVVSNKKSRKRKTLVELRDEETSLVKERRELEREIAELRVILEKKRAANENLKRMKIGFHMLPENERTSDSTLCKRFVVPDLNMPLEEDADMLKCFS